MELLFSIGSAIGIGVALAFYRAPRFVVLGCLFVVFLLSNFLACLPYFMRDPHTWITTYLTGLVETGLASLFFHVVPAGLAFCLARSIRNRVKRPV